MLQDLIFQNASVDMIPLNPQPLPIEPAYVARLEARMKRLEDALIASGVPTAIGPCNLFSDAPARRATTVGGMIGIAAFDPDHLVDQLVDIEHPSGPQLVNEGRRIVVTRQPCLGADDG